MAANSLCSSTQRKSDPKGNSEAIRAASSISKCRAQPENLPQTCGLTAPAQENSRGGRTPDVLGPGASLLSGRPGGQSRKTQRIVL